MSNPFKGAEANEETEETVKNNSEELAESTEDTENVEENNSEEKASDETINELQEKYDTLNNQYIRLAADFDNYRKRQEQERENLLKFGMEETLKKLLTVLDNFERGEKAIADVEDCEKIKESFNLVHNQLKEALTKMGLKEIEATGKEFDPNFHEAVMQTPTSEQEEHTIIAELQKGYQLGDKVLRPTLVNVATAE